MMPEKRFIASRRFFGCSQRRIFHIHMLGMVRFRRRDSSQWERYSSSRQP
jgi:hypothetical protein